MLMAPSKSKTPETPQAQQSEQEPKAPPSQAYQMVQTAYGPKPMSQIMAELAAPFPSSDVEWRVGAITPDKTKGQALAYITARAVQERLDQVMGCGFWRTDYELWRDRGVLCRLSLLINGGWVTKTDGADEPDFEPTKGGLSDALKRAAVQWGIGRYLYRLPAEWVDIEMRGDVPYLKATPTLPDWAVPEEERQQRERAREQAKAAIQGRRTTAASQTQTTQQSGSAPQTKAPATSAKGARPTLRPPMPKPQAQAPAQPQSQAQAQSEPFAGEFTVVSEPKVRTYPYAPRKGMEYSVAVAKTAEGNDVKIVAFEPFKAKLLEHEPGTKLVGMFREVGAGTCELVG